VGRHMVQALLRFLYGADQHLTSLVSSRPRGATPEGLLDR